MAIYTVTVEDYLAFAEKVGTNQHVISIIDTLEIGEFQGEIELHFPFVDHFTFRETVQYSLSAHRSISDTLTFREQAARVREGYVYENFTIHESFVAGAKEWQFVKDNLSFTETANGSASKYANNKLTFHETITVKSVRAPRLVQDTLTFTESAICYVEDPRVIWPGAFVESTWQSGVPASVSVSQTVTFVFNGTTLTLPAPDFGNTESVSATRVQQESQGGTLIISRDPIWPREDGFALKFSYLSQYQVDMLQFLVNTTLGLPITYIDFEGNAWTVVVTNPDLNTTQPSRNNLTVELNLQIILS